MYGIIATWCMAFDGVKKAKDILDDNGDCKDALEEAVKDVEDNVFYKSVGYGGLPNEDGEVELDASFMDGDTLQFGAVGALKDIKNPVSVARSLIKNEVNNFLVGEGALKYAKENQFEAKDMLSERAEVLYQNRLKEMKEEIKPYIGHDTVGMVCLDSNHHMATATSTSGLFMKHAGRLGDSPVCGSGFYVDSEVGGVSSTGLGEDVMKGCVSYEIVRLMKEGMHPQEACEEAVSKFDSELKKRLGKAGDMSFVAMNNQGEWGVASNIDGFSFVVCTDELEPTVYLARPNGDGTTSYQPATKEWLDEYINSRKQEVTKK